MKRRKQKRERGDGELKENREDKQETLKKNE
jgi:hypothetical protein